MEALISKFRDIVGPEWVFTHEHQLRTYESDGLLQYQALPAVAVLPGDGDQVRDVVAACAAANVPFVPRGAGSGLSGGALPIADGVLIVLSRLTRVLEDSDLADRLRHDGRLRASHFTWERTADLTVEAYREAVARGTSARATE